MEEPKLVWTELALASLEEVLDFLEENWTRKEVKQLKDQLELLIELISRYPNIAPLDNQTKFRKAKLNAIVSLFYKLQANRIYILLIWDNRQDPSRISNLLK